MNFVVHENSGMKNVTITMEDEVARWVRVEAAKRDTSVSRFVGEAMRERMVDRDRYERARADFFADAPRRLRRPGQALPTREELHDRSSLRS